jgi:hypothetical protein
MTVHDTACRLLGVIRLVNGGIALLAPRRFLRLLGVDPETNGPAVYVLRMFGVRTVVLGYHLLAARGDVREEAVRDALSIHASDTTAAILAGVTGALPRKAAVSGAIASGVNTTLALLARGRR